MEADQRELRQQKYKQTAPSRAAECAPIVCARDLSKPLPSCVQSNLNIGSDFLLKCSRQARLARLLVAGSWPRLVGRDEARRVRRLAVRRRNASLFRLVVVSAEYQRRGEQQTSAGCQQDELWPVCARRRTRNPRPFVRVVFVFSSRCRQTTGRATSEASCARRE